MMFGRRKELKKLRDQFDKLKKQVGNIHICEDCESVFKQWTDWPEQIVTYGFFDSERYEITDRCKPCHEKKRKADAAAEWARKNVEQVTKCRTNGPRQTKKKT